MAKRQLDSGEKIARMLVTLGVLLALSIGVLVPSIADTPEVQHQAGFERKGYEPAPEQYRVTASYQKRWTDYLKSGGIVLVILGFAVAVGGVYWYCTWAADANNLGKWSGIAGFVVAGALLIFIGFTNRVGSVKYETTLTPEQYHAHEADLDALFPTQK